MVTELYENAVRSADTSEPFGPSTDLDEVTLDGVVHAGDWPHNEEPLRWLFATKGRGRLVIHAINEVATGDPTFQNKSSLAKSADVSRHSVHRHIEELEELNVYEKRGGDGTHIHHRPNRNSRVIAALYKANQEILEYADADF